MRTSQFHIDFLCRLLGESLFPMLLVDHSGTNRRENPSLIHKNLQTGAFQTFPGDVLEGLHRRDPLFLSSFLAPNANFWFGVSKRVGM